jgi:hypothetical protein
MNAKKAREHTDPEDTHDRLAVLWRTGQSLDEGRGHILTSAAGVQRAESSKGISLKKAVNMVRFLAYIRVPKENHTYFW